MVLAKDVEDLTVLHGAAMFGNKGLSIPSNIEHPPPKGVSALTFSPSRLQTKAGHNAHK